MDPLAGLAMGIIPLTEVFRSLDLVPVFDTVFPNVVPSSMYGGLWTLLLEHVC